MSTNKSEIRQEFSSRPILRSRRICARTTNRIAGWLYALRPKKNIPNIFDCNLKTGYQISIVFGMNIPDTTCHQTTIQFPTSPNLC